MATDIKSIAAYRTHSFRDSLSKICKGSDQAMIYGWRHCGYYLMSSGIEFDYQGPIKKAYKYAVGDRTDPTIGEVVTTLEGRRMNLIDYDTSEKELSRTCKTALANVVLENYKRQKEGLPLIPIIFCIDITNNKQPYSIEKICSKEAKLNGQITHRELRRAYKLCTHPNPKIRAIALQTFKFTKLCVSTVALSLEQIPAPWGTSVESPEKVSSTFASDWQARKKNPNPNPSPNNTIGASSWKNTSPAMTA